MTHPDLGIDEYLRERLMPVEGSIPHIPRHRDVREFDSRAAVLCLATSAIGNWLP